jgi:hypothetical protein
MCEITDWIKPRVERATKGYVKEVVTKKRYAIGRFPRVLALSTVKIEMTASIMRSLTDIFEAKSG